jgi:hypothetical protein
LYKSFCSRKLFTGKANEINTFPSFKFSVIDIAEPTSISGEKGARGFEPANSEVRVAVALPKIFVPNSGAEILPLFVAILLNGPILVGSLVGVPPE